MRPDPSALPPSSLTLYNALLSRRRGGPVRIEDLASVRAWAVARGAERFDEDLSVLINRHFVLLNRDPDRIEVLTSQESESALVMLQAERDFPAHQAALEATQ